MFAREELEVEPNVFIEYLPCFECAVQAENFIAKGY
jgi:hypothetical protein